MSSKPLALSGIVDSPRSPNDDAVREMRKENVRLEEESRSLRRELEDLTIEKERLERSVRALRQQLSPLHRALRAVFGEIELAIGEDAAPIGAAVLSSPQSQNANDPKWESYKQTFPGVPARIIDALLAHQQMTMTQLSALLRAHYDTIKTAVRKLTTAGAIVKDGTMCRLNR